MSFFPCGFGAKYLILRVTWLGVTSPIGVVGRGLTCGPVTSIPCVWRLSTSSINADISRDIGGTENEKNTLILFQISNQIS